MPLVVETGTGLSAAESYASVSEADARHVSLGNANWAALIVSKKEEALRLATNYMVQAYRLRWAGQRVNDVQTLDWPRSDVIVDGFGVASNIVPMDVKKACIDLALKASSSDLNPDLERAAIREKVGPLETEYSEYSPQQIRYRAIDQMLAPFLSGSSASYRITRT